MARNDFSFLASEANEVVRPIDAGDHPQSSWRVRSAGVEPEGAQGLNRGLGDAMNLARKLASTIRGDASVGLLDSYLSERHPVGAQVLEWSRAQVALMRPSRSSRALEAIIRDLIDTPDGATYFAERVWGSCSGRVAMVRRA